MRYASANASAPTVTGSGLWSVASTSLGNEDQAMMETMTKQPEDYGLSRQEPPETDIKSLSVWAIWRASRRHDPLAMHLLQPMLQHGPIDLF